MKKYITIDIVIGIVLILFSGWFWILSLGFPEAARMFPQLFLVLTFILSVLMVVGSVRERAREIRHGDNQEDIKEKGNFLKQFTLPCKAYCVMVLYIVGIRFIGFFVATSIFMAAFMYFLNVRKWMTLLSVTAGMDLFLYLMFCVGLKLSLPSGCLF